MTTADLDFSAQREVVEAVLQHYGWRSFWLDITESPHVGRLVCEPSLFRDENDGRR